MVRCFLVLVCGLTVALPPGWCCQVVTLPCRTTDCTPGTATSAEPSCPSCCGAKHKPTSSDRCPVPQKLPIRSCCCEPQPTQRSNSEPTLLDGIGLGTPVLLDKPDGGEVALLPAGTANDGAFLSLHILHCIWLC